MQSNVESGGQDASVASQVSDESLPPVSSSKPVTPPPRPKDGLLPSGSTPIKNHRAVSSDNQAVTEDLGSRLVALHTEISERVVGPVDVDSFIGNFFPRLRAKRVPAAFRAASQELLPLLDAAKCEEDMYAHLVSYFKQFCPSALDFQDRHNSTIRVFEEQPIKPDIVVYDANEVIEAMFEVKYNDADDPFDDGSESFLTTTQRASQTLGQITGYATCHQAIEFQTHVFSALIFRKYMRLLRWDRSGVVVTEQISFDDPLLFDFFFRFCSATAAERGHDPTVITATFDSLTHEQEVRNRLNRSSESPLLDIFADNKHYIISKAGILGSTSPIGRSTRCLKAYCKKTKDLVLLKDTWRVVATTLKREHEIYKKLHDSKVPNIPEVLGGADVAKENDLHHTTQTKRCFEAIGKPLGITLRTLCHYRIVLEYLPYSLEEFVDTWEMTTVVRDASRSHGKAATEAKVLHRDVSNGNIMFKRHADGQAQGYLIDWDLSLDLDLASDPSVEAQLERTGTWQFLATRLVDPDTTGETCIQNRIDDVESFYHLTLWMALRYTAHQLDSENFDALYRNATGQAYIGTARSSIMESAKVHRVAHFANDGIGNILKTMLNTLGMRYTDPGQYTGNDMLPSAQNVRTALENMKAEGLKALEDPEWLPNLLDRALDKSTVTVYNGSNNSAILEPTISLGTCC